MRAVDPTIVIVIVLTIMFLRGDAAALDVLCLVQAGALATRHHAIRLGAVFHVVDALLSAFEAIRLALRQATRGHPLIDTLLLIGLALIDARRIGLGEGQDRQRKRNGGQHFEVVHFFLLDDGWIPWTPFKDKSRKKSAA